MLEYARKLEAALPASPDFHNDTMKRLPAGLDHVRRQAIAASDTFNDLVRGCRGSESRHWKTLGPNTAANLMVWHFIHHYRLAQAVPLAGHISYSDLATATGAHEKDLVQLLRYAMAIHLFHEPSPGYVAHTVDTRQLATSQSHFDEVGYLAEQVVPSATEFVDALRRWPNPQEINQTAYSAYFATDDPFYLHLAEVSDWQRRFGSAMVEFSCGDAEATAATAMAFPWEKLADGAAHVVDVGGGTGHISILLANHHDNMTFTVQDLSGVSATSKASLPQGLAARVSFMDHDYFTEQPVKSADAYFFGMIFHNQTDKYVIRVLRNLIPALAPGARILWCDRDVEPEGWGSFDLSRKTTLVVDMVMKLLMNGKERSLKEKIALFKEANSRFVFKQSVAGTTSFTITEAVWTPG
ncbi:hypothetical protein DOTSEDRAFT_68631 [Dothistroma septosporum NZE10]|uniref:O-methyltransferase C-terminal domain-containing protein n=1 Tax=Dothistroma septosporum (strain NZE10 / CBS 128990) TaxID=675120 RepID=N1Q3T3_DOTSN|nr:hypothetical protein DOTSEDRAFT_68631 [Dothistroma septosporum NZE10]